MEIRKYQEEDLEEIVQLFYETVRTVNRRDYSQEQVELECVKLTNYVMEKRFPCSAFTIFV